MILYTMLYEGATCIKHANSKQGIVLMPPPEICALFFFNSDIIFSNEVI